MSTISIFKLNQICFIFLTHSIMHDKNPYILHAIIFAFIHFLHFIVNLCQNYTEMYLNKVSKYVN